MHSGFFVTRGTTSTSYPDLCSISAYCLTTYTPPHLTSGSYSNSSPYYPSTSFSSSRPTPPPTSLLYSPSSLYYSSPTNSYPPATPPIYPPPPPLLCLSLRWSPPNEKFSTPCLNSLSSWFGSIWGCSWRIEHWSRWIFAVSWLGFFWVNRCGRWLQYKWVPHQGK